MATFHPDSKVNNPRFHQLCSDNDHEKGHYWMVLRQCMTPLWSNMAGWEILYKWSFIAGKIMAGGWFSGKHLSWHRRLNWPGFLHILEVQLLFKTLPMSTLHSVPSFPGVSQCSMAFTAMTPERPTPVAMEISWHREPHVPSRMCSRGRPVACGVSRGK